MLAELGKVFTFCKLHLILLLALGLAYTNVIFAVFTPLMGDDFGIVFSPIYISSLEKPWLSIFSETNAIIENGSHVNYIGQLMSIMWYKFWMSFSLNQSISLFVGFIILKFLLWLTFLETLRRLTKNLVGDRKFSNTAFYCAVVFLFQIRAAWSNDPLTSYPFAGLFAGVCLILGVACTHLAIRKNRVPYYILLVLITVGAFLVYEINISLLAYQLYFVLFLSRDLNGNLTIKRSVLTSASISGLVIFFILINMGGDRSTYTGTTVGSGGFFEFLKTYFFNLFSVFPVFSWPQAISFLSKTSVCIFLGMIIMLIALNQSGKFPNPFEINFGKSIQGKLLETKFPVLPIILLALASVAIQSMTVKTQNDTNGFSTVYTYLIPLLLCSIFICTLIAGKFKSLFHRRRTIIGFGIVLLFQTFLNFSINQGLWNSYRDNTAVIKSVTSGATTEQRCKIISNWNNNNWPVYYRTETNRGLALLSQISRGEKYCPGSR